MLYPILTELEVEALITLSRTLRRRQRHHRRAQLRERLATLETLAREQLNRRKYKQAAYAWAQIEKHVLRQPGGEFLDVTLTGDDARIEALIFVTL